MARIAFQMALCLAIEPRKAQAMLFRFFVLEDLTIAHLIGIAVKFAHVVDTKVLITKAGPSPVIGTGREVL